MILRKNKQEAEGRNTGSDRYLLTYADLLTLLLGLFVILYASSQVDKEKFKEVQAAMSDYFSDQDPGLLDGTSGVLNQTGKGIEPIMPQRGKLSAEEIEQSLNQSLQPYIGEGSLTIRKTADGLVVTLSEKLLFQSGKAEITSEGQPVIDTLGSILKNVRKAITVDGHTDTDPIRSFRYESNWHLSVDRALNVAYKLIQLGVPPYDLSIRGFGSQRPIADNATEEGKALNRRVEITINDINPKGIEIQNTNKAQ